MITTFIGPMFSGKSEKLLDVYNTVYNKNTVIAFKPKMDTRDKAYIKSRNNKIKISTILVETIEQLYTSLIYSSTLPQSYNRNGKIILIDEVQFLKGNVKWLVDLSIKKDYDIYIAGLNLTTNLKPFGIIGQILAISDNIIKLYSSCYYCGKQANYTKCLVNKTNDTLIGSNEYVPICKDCIRKEVIIDNGKSNV